MYVVPFDQPFTIVPQVVLSWSQVDVDYGQNHYQIFTNIITINSFTLVAISTKNIYYIIANWMAVVDNNIYIQYAEITQTINSQTINISVNISNEISYIPQVAFFLNGITITNTPFPAYQAYQFSLESVSVSSFEIQVTTLMGYTISWFSYSVIYGPSKYLLTGEQQFTQLGTIQLFTPDSRTKYSQVSFTSIKCINNTRIIISNNLGSIRTNTYSDTTINSITLSYFQYLPCPLYCTTCYATLPNCDGCLISSQRSGSTCTTCPPQMFALMDQINCQQCSSYCNNCIGASNSCIMCQTATLRSGPPSCTTCPAGLAIDISANNCQPCKSYCSGCSGLIITCNACNPSKLRINPPDCLTCPAQYFIILDYCQQCSSYCNECVGTSNSCSNCLTTTFRMIPPDCTTCPSKMYIVVNNDNCQQCSIQCGECLISSTNCTKCSAITFRINPPACDICPAQMYKQVGSDICEQCAAYCDGCLASTTTCTYCQAISFRIIPPDCVTCMSKYHKLQNNENCEPCPSICDNCQDYTSQCITCSLSSLRINPPQCLKCPVYMFLYGNECKLCPAQCPNCNSDICEICQVGCKNCDQNQCLECSLPNQYISGQNCINCPVQCSTCNNQTCLSCVPPCYSCSFDGCIECIIGYKLDTIDQANQCQAYCLDQVYHPIEQCNDGNTISLDGCTNCFIDPGYVCLNTVGQISLCMKLPDQCLSGQIFQDQVLCSSCKDGYQWKDYICQIIGFSAYYINSISTKDPIRYWIKPSVPIYINSEEGSNTSISFQFSNRYQDNDMILIFNQSLYDNCTIQNINITNYQNADFTYSQSNNQNLNLQFNLSKSINKENQINIQLNCIGQTRNQSINLIIQPNPQQILSQSDINIQQNIQTATQTLSTTVFVAILLTPLLGGFDSIMQLLDIISWLSTFYYINVQYPYNVNQFLSVVSFNYIFFNIPQITTPYNQETDPYYFISPYKFMQNSVDPLFLNNILQPAVLIISPFMFYVLTCIFKIFYTPKIIQKRTYNKGICELIFDALSLKAKFYQKNVLSIILQYFNLNLLDIVLACLLQIACNPPYQYWMIKVNSGLAVITILLVGVNIYNLYCQTKQHVLIIRTTVFKQSYEAIYKGLNVHNWEHRLYGCLLLYSKIAFTYSLVYFYNHPLLQTSFCASSYFFIALFILFYNPYKNKKAFLTQGYPNLCVFGILVVTVILACNENINLIKETENLGWLILGFIATSIGIQICFLIKHQCKMLIRHFKFLNNQICS